MATPLYSIEDARDMQRIKEPPRTHSIDIELYDAYAAKCREVFIAKRMEYGSHLDKPQFYNICGLGEKCYRAFEDMSKSMPVKDDTTVDLVNFSIMVATSKPKREDI